MKTFNFIAVLVAFGLILIFYTDTSKAPVEMLALGLIVNLCVLYFRDYEKDKIKRDASKEKKATDIFT